MSTPTRQEIIDAHEALEELCKHLYGTRYAKLAILKVLPPLPQKTMADVEWDNDKHALAEATHPDYGKVIMLKVLHDGDIKCLTTETVSMFFLHVQPSQLTPTGRRYTLTEVQE